MTDNPTAFSGRCLTPMEELQRGITMTKNSSTGKQFRDCVVSVHPPHPERGAEIQINDRPIPIDEAVEVAEWILRAARPYSTRALSLCGRVALGDAQQRFLEKLKENHNG